MNDTDYNIHKVNNGFLVEKREAPDFKAKRFVFLNPTEVGEFFRDEARALEPKKEKDQPPGDRFYGRPAPTSPVLDYPSPKVGSGKPGMQPPLRLGGAKKPPCPECGSTFKHWMSCSEYTGHL